MRTEDDMKCHLKKSDTPTEANERCASVSLWAAECVPCVRFGIEIVQV